MVLLEFFPCVFVFSSFVLIGEENCATTRAAPVEAILLRLVAHKFTVFRFSVSFVY